MAPGLYSVPCSSWSSHFACDTRPCPETSEKTSMRFDCRECGTKSWIHGETASIDCLIQMWQPSLIFWCPRPRNPAVNQPAILESSFLTRNSDILNPEKWIRLQWSVAKECFHIGKLCVCRFYRAKRDILFSFSRNRTWKNNTWQFCSVQRKCQVPFWEIFAIACAWLWDYFRWKETLPNRPKLRLSFPAHNLQIRPLWSCEHFRAHWLSKAIKDFQIRHGSSHVFDM